MIAFIVYRDEAAVISGSASSGIGIMVVKSNSEYYCLMLPVSASGAIQYHLMRTDVYEVPSSQALQSEEDNDITKSVTYLSVFSVGLLFILIVVLYCCYRCMHNRSTWKDKEDTPAPAPVAVPPTSTTSSI